MTFEEDPPAKRHFVRLDKFAPLLADVKLPKSVALPVLAIVTNSIVSVPLIPPNKALVPEEPPVEHKEPVTNKSPKSVAFPVDPIVTYSITLEERPPANTALVELEAPAFLLAAAVKSPKSVALLALAHHL